GVFIFFDVHEIWPWSRGWAVAIGIPATIALLYMEAFATGAIGFLVFLAGSMVVVVAGFVIYRVVPGHAIPDTEIVGTLHPGNGDDLPNKCPPAESPEAWKIFVGNSAI